MAGWGARGSPDHHDKLKGGSVGCSESESTAACSTCWKQDERLTWGGVCVHGRSQCLPVHGVSTELGSLQLLREKEVLCENQCAVFSDGEV